ncbi:hypothetical protein FCOIX_12652 [Fusarium coicis]|nr:hypothetical protein FCOIX_12652 [Fusarium coicis]
MEPTPSNSAPANSSSPAPSGTSHESISFAGTTTTRREDHLQWICKSMSCNTVNCMYRHTNCKQCGARRKWPADALDNEGRLIGATDPESSSSPSETLDSAPGSSGPGDAVGNMEAGDGSEVSHSERGFENGQSPDWDDEDSEEPEENLEAEDLEGSDR